MSSSPSTMKAASPQFRPPLSQSWQSWIVDDRRRAGSRAWVSSAVPSPPGWRSANAPQRRAFRSVNESFNPPHGMRWEGAQGGLCCFCTTAWAPLLRGNGQIPSGAHGGRPRSRGGRGSFEILPHESLFGTPSWGGACRPPGTIATVPVGLTHRPGSVVCSRQCSGTDPGRGAVMTNPSWRKQPS